MNAGVWGGRMLDELCLPMGEKESGAMLFSVRRLPHTCTKWTRSEWVKIKMNSRGGNVPVSGK